MWRTLVLSALAMRLLSGADLCAAGDLVGPYAFQFSGISTISNAPAPVAGVARLDFDGKDAVSGYSSVNFDGLLLGNPVTGSYEVSSDCKLFWRLQDDSGGYQHFSGVVRPGSKRIEVRQTDSGAGTRGVLEKTSDACKASDFRGRYGFTLSGTSAPLATGGGARGILVNGIADADGVAGLTVTGQVQGRGSFEVDPDCVVRIEVEEGAVKLRGILVNGGKAAVAIQTNPGEPVSARFAAQ